MITVLSRAIHDEFTFCLFKDLVYKVDSDYEAYYLWTHDNSLSRLAHTIFTKPNIIIGIKDFLYESQIKIFQQIFANYKDQNFILFVSPENVLIPADNLQIISWGGDWTNQQRMYKQLQPVIKKNLSSKKTFISLNNQSKMHRIVALSYLIGNNYQGHLSLVGQYVKHFPPTFGGLCTWTHNQNKIITKKRIENMLVGYDKLINEIDLTHGADDNIYKRIGMNNNVTNFDIQLRSLYENSFVELVNESTVDQIFFTEKTLNAIYACNFFILFSKNGTIQHLREIGFDVFDDIIDHKYDLIDNPLDRIITAIESNKKIITDWHYATTQWTSCIKRFENNIRVAKNDMYNYYTNRVGIEFSKLKWK